MEAYFVLDELGDPQPECDIEAWTRWFEQADRSVARTAIGPEVVVLTTFLGVDEAAEPGNPPRLFETRVFGGALDEEELGHSTRTEALAAHSMLVEWCRIGNTPNAGVTEKQFM